MANQIIHNEKGVFIRIDNAYTNSKFFVEPYVKEDGTTSYYGSFKFADPKEAKRTLIDGVRRLGAMDTVFNGQYPKWQETQQYGAELKVSGKVNFYKDIFMSEKLTADEVGDYNYSIEIHLIKTKENEIYLRVARAVVTSERLPKVEDGLFADLLQAQEEEDDDMTSYFGGM